MIELDRYEKSDRDLVRGLSSVIVIAVVLCVVAAAAAAAASKLFQTSALIRSDPILSYPTLSYPIHGGSIILLYNNSNNRSPAH